MKKLFKRNASKKNKTNLDGSFANLSVESSPGRPISQLSNYSAESNYSLSNLSIGKWCKFNLNSTDMKWYTCNLKKVKHSR